MSSTEMEHSWLEGHDRCLLGVGLPLTVVLGGLVAVLLFGSFSVSEAVILGVILAPTDAGLGSAVVTDGRLPAGCASVAQRRERPERRDLRSLLLIALATVSGAGGESHPVRVVVEEIGYGLIGGVAAGVLAAVVVNAAEGRHLIDDAWRQIIPVAAAVLAYGIAVDLGGSGFIAAFVAGSLFGLIARENLALMMRFTEQTGAALDSVTFLVFGAVLLGPVFEHVSWQIALYAVLSLTIVRMLPVATEDATKRLSALSDYTELGAGFKIAMRDLELRGAGNLLGDEQSGHVAALGFELYMSMLDEAVREAGPVEDGDEGEPVRLDVNVDAYVPADYIPYEQAKIDVHRRIAGARDVAELMRLRDELEDRFGPLPQPITNLVLLQQARIKLGRAGARNVSIRGEALAATPVDLSPEQADELRGQVARREVRAGSQPADRRGRQGPGGAPEPRRRGRRRAPGRGHGHARTCGGLTRGLHQLSTLTLSMPKNPRLLTALAVAALLVAVLAACGGESIPGDSVARVKDESVKKDSFNHWVEVAALSSASQSNPAASGRRQAPERHPSRPSRLHQVRRGRQEGGAQARQGPAARPPTRPTSRSASSSTSRCATRSCSS